MTQAKIIRNKCAIIITAILALSVVFWAAVVASDGNDNPEPELAHITIRAPVIGVVETNDGSYIIMAESFVDGETRIFQSEPLRLNPAWDAPSFVDVTLYLPSERYEVAGLG